MFFFKVCNKHFSGERCGPRPFCLGIVHTDAYQTATAVKEKKKQESNILRQNDFVLSNQNLKNLTVVINIKKSSTGFNSFTPRWSQTLYMTWQNVLNSGNHGPSATFYTTVVLQGSWFTIWITRICAISV